MQAAVSDRFCGENRRQNRSQISVFSELQEQLCEPGRTLISRGQITDWLYKKRVDTID
jgi:hypothetical protein